MPIPDSDLHDLPAVSVDGGNCLCTTCTGGAAGWIHIKFDNDDDDDAAFSGLCCMLESFLFGNIWDPRGIVEC